MQRTENSMSTFTDFILPHIADKMARTYYHFIGLIFSWWQCGWAHNWSSSWDYGTFRPPYTHHSTMHAQPFRCPIFGQTFHSSCVRTAKLWRAARMRRLAWAFAGRLCDKYHNLMSWLISPSPSAILDCLHNVLVIPGDSRSLIALVDGAWLIILISNIKVSPTIQYHTYQSLACKTAINTECP